MIELTFLKELMLRRQEKRIKRNIHYYLYSLNKEFKFQPNVCDRCHDLLMMSMNVSNVAILNIKKT